MKIESNHQNQTYMPGLLELSNEDFKRILINMLKALMDKVDTIQEWTMQVGKRQFQETKKKY